MYPVSLSICKEDKFLWISIKTGFAFATKSLGASSIALIRKPPFCGDTFLTDTRMLLTQATSKFPIWQRNCLLGQSEFTFQILIRDATTTYRAIITSKLRTLSHAWTINWDSVVGGWIRQSAWLDQIYSMHARACHMGESKVKRFQVSK